MNFCSNCGNKISSGEKFCTNCGFDLSNDKKETVELKRTSTAFIVVFIIIAVVALIVMPLVFGFIIEYNELESGKVNVTINEGEEEYSNEEFAQRYTLGYIKVMYKNDGQIYREVTGATIEETESYFEDSVEIEVDYFIDYYELYDVTSDQRILLANYVKQLFELSKFEVNLAQKISTNTYEVDVIISPLNIIKLVDEKIIESSSIYGSEEYNNLVTNWNEEIIKMISTEVGNVGYLTDKTVTIEIHVEDDYFIFNEDTIYLLDDEVIKYNYEESNEL